MNDEEDAIMESEDDSYSSNEDDEDEDESFSDDDDEDDSSMGSDMEDEAQRMWAALHEATVAAGAGGGPPPATKTPEQVLEEMLLMLRESQTNALKMDDGIVSFITEIGDRTLKMAAMNKLNEDLLAAIRSCKEIRHVVLGTILLQLLNTEQQIQLYQSLIAIHASTITYWKLGSNDSVELCGIPTSNLLQAMRGAEWPTLTEFQVRGLELSSITQVDMLVELLTKTAPTIKLFNLLGLVLSTELLLVDGLFDRLWAQVEPISQLDEVQLHRTLSSQDPIHLPPLVSHRALQHLLQVKPKWWRMALDGMGLDDGHLQILGNALKQSLDCKMNDLLSVRENPKITSKGLSSLYNVCLNKQRMGLVHSDDPSWVATFDLVRPLNNLHRRLEYKDAEGRFTDPQRWLEWFQVLSNLPWIDETRKLNYIWFTLLEQPEMIQSAISSCSHKN